MTLPSSIEAALAEAGFSSTEILVLNKMLEDGVTTLRQLAVKTGKSTGVLDQAMKKLLKKGIVSKEEINGSPKFTIGSLHTIGTWMEEDMRMKQDMLKRRHQNFESFIATLSLDRTRPEMKYFHGQTGVEQAYFRLLEMGKDMIAYLPIATKEEEDPLRDFRVQYFRMRRNNEIFCRIIARDTTLGRRFASRDAFEYRKTLLLPEAELAIPFEKIVIGGTIACFDIQKMTACFVQYPELADAERGIFESIWRRTPPRKAANGAPEPAPHVPIRPTVATRLFSQLREFFLSPKSLVSFGALILAAAALTLGFYWYNVAMNVARIRERLESIAATGALQFDAAELHELRTLKDVEKPVYGLVVTKLQHIRSQNDAILYTYLIRPKPGSVFEFIADADGGNPGRSIDVNGDGAVDGADEIGLPGRQYDVQHIAVLNEHDYNEPISTDEPYKDQWGKVYTGYAPIFNGERNVVGILVLDMRAESLSDLGVSVLPFIGLFFIALILFLVLRLWAFNQSLFKELVALAMKRRIATTILVAIATVSLLITAFVWYGCYVERRELGERLLSIVATAAPRIPVEHLDKFQKAGDMRLPEYQEVFRILNEIRQENRDIKYVYIMRPTENDGIWEFVVDADSNFFKPFFQQGMPGFDVNSSEADEIAPPGTRYDIEFSGPEFNKHALERPVLDNVVDQWGNFFTACSPIKSKGAPIAVLCIDKSVDS
jgi:predicted transcriptional regulator